MKKAAVYYSDKSITERLRSLCLDQLQSALPPGVDLIKIMQSSRAVRGHISLFINILCGIGQSDADYIYLAEHDVLYPAGYFTEGPEWLECDFVYAQPGYYLNATGYYIRNGLPLSCLSGRRESLVKFCLMQLVRLLSNRSIISSEPSPKDWHIKIRQLDHPFIDIRHNSNFTGSRQGKHLFQQIDYWPEAAIMWLKTKEDR